MADRYLAQWNEPDPAARAALITELWAPDAVHVLVHPPQQIRDAAANLAIPAPPLVVRGHDALRRRVDRAYQMFVESGEHVFVLAEVSVLLPAVYTLRWSMRSTARGTVDGGGADVLAVDEAGRIRTDHQYIG
ncbi:hypothetical protein Asera_58870 [Actinocatenispora sera]|uniref:Nuclear transport factor 2 family protein n=1 Tax=Actinocatenispora sera TaxID=390989 RepID=A0A810L956_9ACTN|nr:hypothetical protein Asera_58870 [Actinocatenispora sera]